MIGNVGVGIDQHGRVCISHEMQSPSSDEFFDGGVRHSLGTSSSHTSSGKEL